MADEIVIETTSAEVIEVGVPGPQGPAGAAGAGLTTLTTAGDLLYRDNTEPTRLPIGSNGQVLKVAGGLPVWQNESGAVTSVNGATGAVVISSFSYGTGNSGLVPQATGGDAGRFLKGDGTWSLPTTDNITGLSDALAAKQNAGDYVTPTRVETDWFDRGGDNAATRAGTGGQKRYQVVLSNDTRLTDARQMLWRTPPPTSPTDGTSGVSLGSMSYDGSYLYILVQTPGGQSVRWARTPMAINW